MATTSRMFATQRGASCHGQKPAKASGSAKRTVMIVAKEKTKVRTNARCRTEITPPSRTPAAGRRAVIATTRPKVATDILQLMASPSATPVQA